MDAVAAVSCTLSITTTDSLPGTGHYTYTGAVPLANYTGLALAPGNKGDEVLSHDDWFALNNATLNGTYQIDAVPDLTNNYNLGITVYNAYLTPIYSDIDPVSNNYAHATFKATTYDPYYVRCIS
jgi:hypothetical protein